MLCAVGKVLKIITRKHQEMAFIELWLDEFASKLKTESNFVMQYMTVTLWKANGQKWEAVIEAPSRPTRIFVCTFKPPVHT